MFNRNWWYIAFIVLSTFAILYSHFATAREAHALHSIYNELHYVPLIVATVVFGLRGALFAFLFISASYSLYILFTLNGGFLSVAEKTVHLLFSGLVTLLAGSLVDSERKHRAQSEKDRYLAGLGQASSAIVHDLKNPLITISGFAQRIRERKGDIDASLDIIVDSAQVMQRIVHDVLDFAKPVQLTLQKEDIRNTLERVHSFCKVRAEAQGVTLTLRLPGEPVKALVENYHMERALINLVNNAVDASDHGQRVEITLRCLDEKLLVSIKDTGAGMDRETLENIFLPFYTKKSTGTGLGMPIAKKIIEAHGGTITISSQEGKGTEVIVELPFERK
ncbi:MAG: HAMP domain-containing histidine kinase [Alphaproteobacteria bacterium]|uniref:histidine kinase n=1 Tax=Candidatus Nitrobium versatile TaxID=2884831 RepID=A0A953JFV2_9BACT|nr:HAMP domain-containing histidine kinase [Candidatus Nitrobium versatile]